MSRSRSHTITSNAKVDKFVHEIKSAFALDRQADPDAFLSKLKSLFKECDELRGIPVHYRGDVRCIQLAVLMSLVEFEPGTIVITEGNVTPDLYIVLTGALEAKSTRSGSFRHGILIRQFQACGYVAPLTQADWVTCTVKALERTEVITVSRPSLSNFIKTIDQIKETAELMDFIISTVPGARFLGQGGKEKIISYFEKCGFKKDDKVLCEGLKSEYAFIVRSGECLKTSSRNDSKSYNFSPLKGFTTKTTQSYILSLVTAKQWVGEESLIYDTALEYSVVATNQVSALRIHKLNFLEKLPKETLQALRVHVDSKRIWKTQRQNKIKSTWSQAIYGPEEDEFTKAMYKNSRHPAASVAASSSMLKQHILDKSQSPDSASSRKSGLSQNNSFFVIEKTGRTPSPGVNKSYEMSARPYTSLIRESESLTPSPPRVYYQERKNPFAIKTPSLKAVGFHYSPSNKQVRKSLSPTKVGSRSVREHFGYKNAEPKSVGESYIQLLLKPRPASPNPAEIWIRKHNLEMSSLASIRTASPAKEAAGL